MICSKGKFDPELDKILSLLLENGYPENLIKSTIKRKLQQLEPGPHNEKMPSLLTHSMDRKRFDEVRKADHLCRKALLLFR